MRKVVVSQLVRRRIQNLRKKLLDRFGEEVDQKAVTSLVESIEGLGQFPEKGIQISKMYSIDTEYYYLFFEHNYIVYRFNDKEVIILRLFDERGFYADSFRPVWQNAGINRLLGRLTK